jgi:hypothetical protein
MRGCAPRARGRGDPCTRYQAQSCAKRTTLLSVSIDPVSTSDCSNGLEASGIPVPYYSQCIASDDTRLTPPS